MYQLLFALESEGFGSDPGDKFLDSGMGFQLFDGVEFSFHFLFGQQDVNLIVARSADVLNCVPVIVRRFLFRFLVAVPGDRNEMMPGEHRLSFAQSAISSHSDHQLSGSNGLGSLALFLNIDGLARYVFFSGGG
jgi:hypothetical protein